MKWFCVTLDGESTVVEATDEADAIRLAKCTLGMVDVCHQEAVECDAPEAVEEAKPAKKSKKSTEPSE